MHKNKMTLFAVILFGFSTAFSMQKAYNSIEDVIKDLKKEAQDLKVCVNALPNYYPRKVQIAAKLDEYSRSINEGDIDKTQCLQKLCVVQNMLALGMVELALIRALVIQQTYYFSSEFLNNQNKK